MVVQREYSSNFQLVNQILELLNVTL